MKIGVIGSGHIGGNAARLFAKGGHEVLLSFSHDPQQLNELAASIGHGASAGSVRDAVAFGDVVMVSVPWPVIPDVLREAGSLDGKIVIDTTNQYGENGIEKIPDGLTAAQFNQRRMPGARLVKSFNTLTSGFQEEAAQRPADQRVAMFLCGDDRDAKAVVAQLITDAGFDPVDVGGLADATVMEAPRRSGSVYGEEYRRPEALEVVAAVREGRPIPATPKYG